MRLLLATIAALTVAGCKKPVSAPSAPSPSPAATVSQGTEAWSIDKPGNLPDSLGTWIDPDTKCQYLVGWAQDDGSDKNVSPSLSIRYNAEGQPMCGEQEAGQ